MGESSILRISCKFGKVLTTLSRCKVLVRPGVDEMYRVL